MSHPEVLTSLSQSYNPCEWCKLFNMWDNPVMWNASWESPRNERLPDPSGARRTAWGIPRRGFWPFGVERLRTSEEKQVMPSEWVRNVIQPIAHLLFNAQIWKHGGDDDDDEEDGDDDGDEENHQHCEKEYQRLMKCDTILRFHSVTEQDIAHLSHHGSSQAVPKLSVRWL